jgi:hypothetical protein
MHDHKHHDRGVPEDGTDHQVIEAPAQPALQPQTLEQGLEHHETGERGQLLVLETDLRQRAGFPMHGRLANLHTDGRLSGLDPTCGNADHNRVEAVFSFQTNNLNDLQRSPKVRVAEPFNRASQAGITGADASASEILCTWRVDLADLSSAVRDREHRTLLIGRLQRLGELGLAERLAPDRWQISPDFERLLRSMGERGDIIRRMQRALGGQRRELGAFGNTEAPESITGRLAAKGIADPACDRGYLIVDNIDGRAYHIAAPSRVDLGELPVGAILAVTNSPKPRPADRTIAALARDGLYRTSEHLAEVRADVRPGRDPEAFVEAHVRRLEALRRARIVERLEEGVWRVPGDLVERGRAYDARRSGGIQIEVQSYLPIERQVRVVGATWLDRLLVDSRDDLSSTGFGSDVSAALADREGFLVREGLAERRGQRLVLTRNLLVTLRARELESVAAKVQAESGLVYRQVVDGVPITGTFRRSVVLASGRFAMLDDGVEFSLVPWRPVLEGRTGQPITAVTRGDRVSWNLSLRLGVAR